MDRFMDRFMDRLSTVDSGRDFDGDTVVAAPVRHLAVYVDVSACVCRLGRLTVR
jgi:hypothetical protein